MQNIFRVNYLVIYGQIFIRTSYFTFMFVISYMHSIGCLMIEKGLANVSFIKLSIFTFAQLSWCELMNNLNEIQYYKLT